MINCTHYLTEDGFVRLYILNSAQIVARASEIHLTTPVCTAALGRTLTAASLLGSMLKAENQSVTVQIRGGGPAGTLLAVSEAGGDVRGYVTNPTVALPLNSRGKLDVAGAVGTDGFLNIIRDMGMKEPYAGQTELVSGEIAEDLAHYFVQSEQTPSVVALGVLVDRDYSIKAAGGYILQLLPGAPDNLIDVLEENLQKLPSVTTMFDQGRSLDEIAESVLSGMPFKRIFEGESVYRCGCSRQRVERALISLGKEELERLAGEQETTEVGCQFCDRKFTFSKEDLLTLIKT